MNGTPGMLNETHKRSLAQNETLNPLCLLETKATKEWEDWLSILLNRESGDEGVRRELGEAIVMVES